MFRRLPHLVPPGPFLIPFLLAAAPWAGAAPLLDVSFEEIERGGRYDLGPIAHQPALERDGEPVALESQQWSPVGVSAGATVNGDTAAPSGSRILSFDSPAAVEKSIPPTTAPVVWVEGWHRGGGASRTLAQADYPTAEDGFDAAAIVHFSAANGIELLDGDGTGGGTPVTATRAERTGGPPTWTRVTLRLDYAGHVWECYLDGERAHPGVLGFRDNSARPTALRLQSGAPEGADAFRALIPLPGDANTDGVVDAADLVRARQFLAYDPATYDIIGVHNVSVAGATDAQGHLIVTEGDLDVLRGHILGAH